MKREKLVIVISLCLFMVSIVFSLYLFPRVFGDTETKAMYKIESILKSYINIKSDNLVDFINHTFHTGSYEYENDKLKFSFGVKTGENITDVLSDASSLCNEITTYTKNNSDINGKNVDISIRIEHWSEWVVILEPNSNRIIIGLGHQMSITQMLSYCKEFEIIDIGGYWGYEVSIPDDIENDFFMDFNALRVLIISDIQTPEMEQHINEAVSNLLEKGVTVIARVREQN